MLFPNTILCLALAVTQAFAGGLNQKPLSKGQTPDYSSERRFPTWRESALLARRILGISNTATFTTIFHGTGANGESVESVPVGLEDYYATCPDSVQANEILGEGNPLIIGFDIGTTFHNVERGSNLSLALNWWGRSDLNDKQESPLEKALHAIAGNRMAESRDPLDDSLANMPRFSMIGHLERLNGLDKAQYRALESCFLESHPDAVMWLPNHEDAAHKTYWSRLVVEKVFWLGGFGDRARLGWLDIDDWRSIKKDSGYQQKGWADVRLPGEN